MPNFNINNLNPGRSLLDPFVRVTIGKVGSKEADVFTIGDGKLKNVSVSLGEGKNQSNCSFSVYDPTKRLTDKYFSYVESVGGLDPLPTPTNQTQQPAVNSNSAISQDGVTGTTGKVIFNSTKATVFNDKMGSRGNKLDPDNVFGCAMRYNNPAAAKQFGSQGMIDSLNFGDKVRVTNPANGKSCICEIQDWGPNPRLADKGIDLFTKAFNFLSNTQGYQAAYNIGVLPNIKVEHIEKATTSSSNTNNKSKQQVVTEQAKAVKKQITTVNQANLTSQDKASLSIAKAKSPEQEAIPTVTTKSGSQITIEMGYGGKVISAFSFIHIGLRYSLFDPDSLDFTGQAASWVLTQRIKNTVYTNITFKKLAQKITSSYGLNLVMPEDGPKYEYFPQRGQTDYDALLIEARRIGYRVYTKGATLYIQPRKGVDPNQSIFVLEYGDNMGVNFEVNHQASNDSTGGARSSTPGSGNTTGERKFEIDPISGQVKQKRKENIVGTGTSKDSTVTGSTIALPAPKTTGDTNTSDSQRKANEDRIKGITANAGFITTPEALTLDPDTPFKTEGISTSLNRFWVIDTISHEYSGGKLTTKLACYSPLKNKNPSPTISEGTSVNNSSSSNPFDSNAPKFIRPMTVGTVTSRHRTENPRRPKHRGIDISSVGGTGAGGKVIASATGTVIFAGMGSNANQRNGYGNVVDIDHGGGWVTRYAHLYSLNVTTGQQVNQGQQVGVEGNSGFSRGTHLHTEVRLNGNDLNPLKFYKA